MLVGALIAASPTPGTVILNWTDASSNETRFDLAQDDSKTVVNRLDPFLAGTRGQYLGHHVVLFGTLFTLDPGASCGFRAKAKGIPG